MLIISGIASPMMGLFTMGPLFPRLNWKVTNVRISQIESTLIWHPKIGVGISGVGHLRNHFASSWDWPLNHWILFLFGKSDPAVNYFINMWFISVYTECDSWCTRLYVCLDLPRDWEYLLCNTSSSTNWGRFKLPRVSNFPETFGPRKGVEKNTKTKFQGECFFWGINLYLDTLLCCYICCTC